ncbi:MAG TPA: aminopeptidase P family protein, partial [Firmicutes bacterium]|nr:aminopeptidase P family protein [Bacillota bacterium]
MDIERIRKELTRLDLDGWLLYDFQGINPIAREIAGLTETFLTRRWFCLIRREGSPTWLVSRIERGQFANVQGEVRAYLSWSDLQQQLNDVLGGCKAVAMEYAPDGAIPYISRVDGGTLEMVAAADIELVSSADLIQWCQARWSTQQLATHMEASRHLNTARELAFRFIGESIRDAHRITEYDVQQKILEFFAQN